MDDLLTQLPREIVEEHILRYVDLSSLLSFFSLNRHFQTIRDNIWFWKRRLSRLNDDRLQAMVLTMARHNNLYLLTIVSQIDRFVNLDLRTLILAYYSYMMHNNVLATKYIKENYHRACSAISTGRKNGIMPVDWMGCFFDHEMMPVVVSQVEAVQRLMNRAESDRTCGRSVISSLLVLYRLSKNPLPNLRLYHSFLGRLLSRSITLDNLWMFFYIDYTADRVEDSTWYCDGVDLNRVEYEVEKINNNDADLLDTIGHSLCEGLVERLAECKNTNRIEATTLRDLIRRFAFSSTYRQSIVRRSDRSLLNWLGLSDLASCCNIFCDRRLWNREWRIWRGNRDQEIGQWLLMRSYTVLRPEETIEYAKEMERYYSGSIDYIDKWALYHAQADGYTRWVDRYCELKATVAVSQGS